MVHLLAGGLCIAYVASGAVAVSCAAAIVHLESSRRLGQTADVVERDTREILAQNPLCTSVDLLPRGSVTLKVPREIPPDGHQDRSLRRRDVYGSQDAVQVRPPERYLLLWTEGGIDLLLPDHGVANASYDVGSASRCVRTQFSAATQGGWPSALAGWLSVAIPVMLPADSAITRSRNGVVMGTLVPVGAVRNERTPS